MRGPGDPRRRSRRRRRAGHGHRHRPRRSAGRHRAHAAGHRRPTRSARRRRGGPSPPARGGRSRRELRRRASPSPASKPPTASGMAACESRRPFAAWVHAGHVPMPHFLERTFGAVRRRIGCCGPERLRHAQQGLTRPCPSWPRRRGVRAQCCRAGDEPTGSGILAGQRIDGPGHGLEDGRWTRRR